MIKNKTFYKTQATRPPGLAIRGSAPDGADIQAEVSPPPYKPISDHKDDMCLHKPIDAGGKVSVFAVMED